MGEWTRLTGIATGSVLMVSNGGGGSNVSFSSKGGGSGNCVLPEEPSSSSVK